MKSRFACLSISILGGIIGFVFAIIALVLFMHLTVSLNYNIEKHVINPITANWQDNRKDSYACNPQKEYSDKLEKSNKDTEYFYSYDFYYKLYEYPILPYLNIFIVALLDLLIVNVIYLAVYFLLSAPFIEVFKCANPTITLIYTVLIIFLVASLCFLCVFTALYCVLRRKCRNCDNNTILNDDMEKKPNDSSPIEETINVQLLDV